VADQDGNMVSLIQSNYRGMGSGMTPPGLGFVLQDRGELFSLADGAPTPTRPASGPSTPSSRPSPRATASRG
jgi:gamma-glutamyltranspeptidase / glutathione hydrolase